MPSFMEGGKRAFELGAVIVLTEDLAARHAAARTARERQVGLVDAKARLAAAHAGLDGMSLRGGEGSP